MFVREVNRLLRPSSSRECTASVSFNPPPQRGGAKGGEKPHAFRLHRVCCLSPPRRQHRGRALRGSPYVEGDPPRWGGRRERQRRALPAILVLDPRGGSRRAGGAQQNRAGGRTKQSGPSQAWPPDRTRPIPSRWRAAYRRAWHPMRQPCARRHRFRGRPTASGRSRRLR